LIWFAISCATIGSAAIAAWPHVRALPPDEAFDPKEPYKLPFYLQNNGNLPIYDAEVQCHPKHLTFELFQRRNIAARVTAFRRIGDKISSTDKRPFACNSWEWMSGIGPNGMYFTPPGPLFRTTAADLIVTTRFRVVPFVSWMWWPVDQTFKTYTDSDSGKTYWREYRPPLR
jgi:hypothetical protein